MTKLRQEAKGKSKFGSQVWGKAIQHQQMLRQETPGVKKHRCLMLQVRTKQRDRVPGVLDPRRKGELNQLKSKNILLV